MQNFVTTGAVDPGTAILFARTVATGLTSP